MTNNRTPCLCPQHGKSHRLPSGLPACCIGRYREKHDRSGPRPGPEVRLVKHPAPKRGRKRKGEEELNLETLMEIE